MSTDANGAPGVRVYRRGKYWHGAFRVRGKVVRRSLLTTDEATARAVAASVAVELLAERVLAGLRGPGRGGQGGQGAAVVEPAPKPAALSLDAAWAKYEAWARVSIRPGSAKQFAADWRDFVATCRPKDTDAITPATLEGFKRRLVERGTAPKTVNNKVKAIKAVVNRLGKLGVPVHNLAGVAALKLAKRPPRCLAP